MAPETGDSLPSKKVERIPLERIVVGVGRGRGRYLGGKSIQVELEVREEGSVNLNFPIWLPWLSVYQTVLLPAVSEPWH